MSLNLPPLKPLRAFEAAARLGAFTKAADELGVTHGAISQQLRGLEVSLGVRLFERVQCGVALTAEGQRLHSAVGAAFSGLSQLMRDFLTVSYKGRLVVNCVPSLLSNWLLPRLDDFLSRFPDIELSFLTSNDPRLLHDKSVDIGIFYGSGEWPGYWQRRLFDVEISAFVSPGLMLHTPLNCVQDLAAHTLLHSDDGGEWQHWISHAGTVHVTPARNLYFPEAQLAAEAATHGLGVVLCDRVTSVDFLRSGRLVNPIKATASLADSFYVCCRTEDRNAPQLSGFIDWIFDAQEHTHRSIW